MNSSAAAEEVVKLSLDGIEVAARVTGAGAKNIAVLLYTMSKDKKITKGKVKLNSLLRSGSPLKIFSLKNEELRKFHKEAKKYGVQYSAIIDKKTNGSVDLMIRAEDASRVNRIVENLKLATVEVANIEQTINTQETNKEKLDADILPKQTEKKVINPQLAETEKSPLLEPQLKNTNNQGTTFNKEKKSVRKLLKDIENNINHKEKGKNLKKEKGTDLNKVGFINRRKGKGGKNER